MVRWQVQGKAGRSLKICRATTLHTAATTPRTTTASTSTSTYEDPQGPARVWVLTLVLINEALPPFGATGFSFAFAPMGTS